MDHLIAELGKTQGTFAERYRRFHTITVGFGYLSEEFCVAFITLAPELTGSRTCHERSIIAVYKTLLSSLEGLIEQGKREGSVREDRERNGGPISERDAKR